MNDTSRQSSKAAAGPGKASFARSELIKSLYYPLSLIQGQIDVDQCPHAGSFDASDPHCQECDQAGECKWLSSHDRFSALNLKSDEELIESLEYGCDYVGSFAVLLSHNPRACMCEACSWVRDTRALLQRFDSA